MSRKIFILALSFLPCAVFAGADEDLWKAIEKEDIAAVESALKKNASPFALSSNGRSALFESILYGKLKISKLLIAKIKRPNQKQKEYLSKSLAFVGLYEPKDSDAERTEIAEQLIHVGADLNYYHLGSTSLFRAAYSGGPKLVQLLLRKGANVNLRSEESETAGMTPLIAAARQGNSDSIKLLLEAGAKINAVDSDGVSALLLAASRQNDEAVKVLLQHKADTQLRSKNGYTALSYAEEKRYKSTANLLRAAGAKGTATPNNLDASAAKKFPQKSKTAEDERTPAEIRYQTAYVAKAKEKDKIDADLAKLTGQKASYREADKRISGERCNSAKTDCTPTYQGGGESGSSYYSRTKNRDQIRSLELRSEMLKTELEELAKLADAEKARRKK